MLLSKYTILARIKTTQVPGGEPKLPVHGLVTPEQETFSWKGKPSSRGRYSLCREGWDETEPDHHRK